MSCPDAGVSVGFLLGAIAIATFVGFLAGALWAQERQ